jgi:hypothetical protein
MQETLNHIRVQDHLGIAYHMTNVTHTDNSMVFSGTGYVNFSNGSIDITNRDFLIEIVAKNTLLNINRTMFGHTDSSGPAYKKSIHIRSYPNGLGSIRQILIS